MKASDYGCEWNAINKLEAEAADLAARVWGLEAVMLSVDKKVEEALKAITDLASKIDKPKKTVKKAEDATD